MQYEILVLKFFLFLTKIKFFPRSLILIQYLNIQISNVQLKITILNVTYFTATELGFDKSDDSCEHDEALEFANDACELDEALNFADDTSDDLALVFSLADARVEDDFFSVFWEAFSVESEVDVKVEAAGSFELDEDLDCSNDAFELDEGLDFADPCEIDEDSEFANTCEEGMIISEDSLECADDSVEFDESLDFAKELQIYTKMYQCFDQCTICIGLLNKSTYTCFVCFFWFARIFRILSLFLSFRSFARSSTDNPLK